MNYAKAPHIFNKAHRGTAPDCSECAREKVALRSQISRDMLFSEAFKAWISRRTIEEASGPSRVRYLKPKSKADYENCASALEKFKTFRTKPIGELAPDDLMDYQNARGVNAPDSDGKWWCHKGKKPQGPHETREAAALWAEKQGGGYELKQTIWAMPCGANHMRKEISLMVRILRDARLWGEEEEESLLRVRAEESDVVHAMTRDEQHRFLHVASNRLEFRTIYQYAIVALQTTASTNEMRELRLCDILLDDRIIQVSPAGSKNSYRQRAIPILTKDCKWALEGLIERARSLGSERPTHHLFPFRVKLGEWNPARPMSDTGLKKQWEAVRSAAQLPELRMYDLRHTGITRMAEAGVPLAVAMTFAGHMTRQMQQRYTAICMAAQREWGSTVWGDGMASGVPPRKPVAAAGSSWNHDRKQVAW